MPDSEGYDVAIVGGGPAGQAAGELVAAAGLSVCMVDEQQRPGGQILRQPPTTFLVPRWMRKRLYRKLRAQLDRIEGESGLKWFGGTSVTGIWPENDAFRLSLAGGLRKQLSARRVLVAGGCYDMPVPLPGWTLPGVMSSGGLQTLLKGQQIIPEGDIILFGTHPLMLVLAEQLISAGASVRAVLFAQPKSHLLRLSIRHALSAMRAFESSATAFQSLARLRKSGVCLGFGTRVERLVGHEGKLSGADVCQNGHSSHVPCTVAAFCFGFLPQSDLPRAAGADVYWSEPAGGWATRHDGAMRSSVPGLYVAGETTGVAGADAALLDGAIAGLSIALDAGRLSSIEARRKVTLLRQRRDRLRGFEAFLRAFADPRPWFPSTAPDTLVCRCEDVTSKEVDDAIAAAVSFSRMFDANAVKLRCRAGMGLCQGRSCEHSIVRRIAAATDRSPAAVRGFSCRYPARPIPIADLITNR